MVEASRSVASTQPPPADLQALAPQDRGRILVGLGSVAEGMAHIDEATSAVAARS
jgi:hypothetical protein